MKKDQPNKRQAEKQGRWHRRFAILCDHIAAWSEDVDYHVGAVIVGKALEIRATGFNGLPRGVSAQDKKRFHRPSGEKFFWFEHAERNAIYHAARLGVSIEGCAIYINRFPCADCARAIIQSGLGYVFCPPIDEDDGMLDKSFKAAATMLEEAHIAVSHEGFL
ncbi:MAG: deaminase [Pseudomonadota bacterium]